MLDTVNRFDDEGEKRRHLADIAFSGVFYGLADSAWVIFDYLEAKDENREVCLIGKAFCNLSAGQYEEARRLLEERVLKENPQSIEAKVFMALLFKLTGHNAQAEKFCRFLTENGEDIFAQLGQQIRNINIQ